jgi:hypothetical protein
MFASEWSAAYVPSGRGSRGAAWLSGPGVDDLVLDIAQRLAEATDPDDGLFDAWDAYAAAHRTVVRATRDGEPTEAELDAEADAWDALVLDLGTAVRVPLPETAYVAALMSAKPRGRMSRWLHVWRERVAA